MELEDKYGIWGRGQSSLLASRKPAELLHSSWASSYVAGTSQSSLHRPYPCYSHFLHALGRLLQAVPADEVVVNLSIFDASIWRLPTSHDLPHGHPKGPLV